MLVPSMLIHPLVENSLKYCGSGGTHGMANIRISAKHTEKLLELHIEDTSSPVPGGCSGSAGRNETDG